MAVEGIKRRSIKTISPDILLALDCCYLPASMALFGRGFASTGGKKNLLFSPTSLILRDALRV